MKGRVSCMLRSQACFKTYTEESYFGDIEVLKNVPRIFSVRANTKCSIMIISRDMIDRSCRTYPELQADLYRRSIKRLISLRIAMSSFKCYDGINSKDAFWHKFTLDKDSLHDSVSIWLNKVAELNSTPVFIDHFSQRLKINRYTLNRSRPGDHTTAIRHAASLSDVNEEISETTEVDGLQVKLDELDETYRVFEGKMVDMLQRYESVVDELELKTAQLDSKNLHLKSSVCDVETQLRQILAKKYNLTKDSIIDKITTIVNELKSARKNKDAYTSQPQKVVITRNPLVGNLIPLTRGRLSDIMPSQVSSRPILETMGDTFESSNLADGKAKKRKTLIRIMGLTGKESANPVLYPANNFGSADDLNFRRAGLKRNVNDSKDETMVEISPERKEKDQLDIKPKEVYESCDRITEGQRIDSSQNSRVIEEKKSQPVFRKLLNKKYIGNRGHHLSSSYLSRDQHESNHVADHS
jgi:hypothetical protein